MSDFTFLYRGRDTNASPEQMQKTMEKWRAWFKQLGEQGHLKDIGHPLENSGKVVRGKQKSVTDGPFAEAEDVVQDAFCRALEVWSFRGVPENPSAWLMAAAKNRALDVLRREKTTQTYEPELTRLLQSEWTLTPVVEEMFTENAIKDDQLRMMFSCCHPRLPEDAQVMLILHILCGFGIDEVASAFVTTHTAVERRIPRAKKVLAGS